ncbi:Tetracycline resistance protein TetA/multidrug resistance protein MdtG [Penicillium concentricum]|uniref:Tetracycline resistance protein TetA/multidrug resistance protein MdtG n=1 Tax=Penicillium concentricum TaxID=293559 RepID=A0A9W9VAS0_9EURO|nr:Tetracycline resistance protein TetA/multidrug resistance protein MdtG [Penicillium concentricum]KAJ5372521.1 Tetracycline resistance protein TetA/multidrug resistance protein MdtG [Penicillium concentricum]
MDDTKPWGYRWRSSRLLVVSSITVALFAETFLYGFLTPILSYMLEERLHLDPSQTQTYTTALLTTHGFIGLISAPIVAHLAEKTPSQKKPLLISLAGCFLGTLIIALAPSVWALFLGRILQSMAGAGTWVVGFALLANNVDKKHLGQSMGMAMSFVTAGMVGGPTVSGALLQLFGYWAAWSLPLVVLVLDIIARLVMIEPGLGSPKKTETLSKTAGTSVTINDGGPEESTALLSDTPSTLKPDDCRVEHKHDLKHEYYRVMLSDPRVLTALANVVVVSSLMSGINNTLPVHLREAFGWKSLLISMMFFCLQVPNIVLSGPSGWLRDRIGIRGPTVFGWLAMIPLILLLGIPGDPHFPWAAGDAAGKSIFTSSLIALGSILPLVRGVGAVQLAYVVKDMEAKDAHLFEANRSNLRVFSMTEVGYSLGMMFGPMLTGSLFEGVGFFYMTVALAITCLIQAVVSWRWLDTLPEPEVPEASV